MEVLPVQKTLHRILLILFVLSGLTVLIGAPVFKEMNQTKYQGGPLLFFQLFILPLFLTLLGYVFLWGLLRFSKAKLALQRPRQIIVRWATLLCLACLFVLSLLFWIGYVCSARGLLLPAVLSLPYGVTIWYAGLLKEGLYAFPLLGTALFFCIAPQEKLGDT